MNRHSLIFATALILLFSRSAHSQQANAQTLLIAGHAAAKKNDCPTVLKNFRQLVAEYEHLRDRNKEEFKFADDWILHCKLKKPVTVASVTVKNRAAGFELHAKDLNEFWPPSLSNGHDHRVVKEITDKLGVPAIKVYDIPGLGDAFAVKPVPGAMPVFKDAPQFEGIIVDSRYMDIRVDVTPEEIADMVRLNRDVPSFIEHGRERRYGLLAHEVAHMLLPDDLRGFIARNVQKKDIQVQNARVKRVLENLHDAISEGKFNRSYGMNWQFVNEMAADYVAGGILAYMEVGEEGVEYMLKMYDLAGDSGNMTHLRGNERGKIIHMGYEAHSVE